MLPEVRVSCPSRVTSTSSRRTVSRMVSTRSVAALLITTSSFTRAALETTASSSVSVSFDSAICKGSVANLRPGRDRAPVDRHMLGMQRDGLLNRSFHDEPAYTGGAAVYQPLAHR